MPIKVDTVLKSEYRDVVKARFAALVQKTRAATQATYFDEINPDLKKGSYYHLVVHADPVSRLAAIDVLKALQYPEDEIDSFLEPWHKQQKAGSSRPTAEIRPIEECGSEPVKDEAAPLEGESGSKLYDLPVVELMRGYHTSLPTGTVTFMATDVERSTRLWEAASVLMRKSIGRHDTLVREIIERRHGYIFATGGDGFFAAFSQAQEAMDAAVEIQQAIQKEAWHPDCPIRVRIGLHTGEAEERNANYYGTTVNRLARLMKLAHGEQTVLSGATYSLLQERQQALWTLTPLGEHRLADLQTPEQVYQVGAEGLRATFPPLKSLNLHPNNLPYILTRFIGRDSELQQIGKLLSRSRLVTLTGVGGSGKTRLALQVAARNTDQFPDGVWWINLESIEETDQILRTIQQILGLPETLPRHLASSVQDYLKGKKALLVLDNCEHLSEEASEVCRALLENCPRLTILATSQHLLNVRGEQNYPLLPTALPSDEAAVNPSVWEENDSIRLFVDRAEEAGPIRPITIDDAPAILRICRLMDNLPLAIEFAAAQTRILSPTEIAQKLETYPDDFYNDNRRYPDRHETLKSVIDWSYGLLTPQEQELLQAMAIFAGSFGGEALEAIYLPAEKEQSQFLTTLMSVKKKSLVMTEPGPGQSRYLLLSAVRRYGESLLDLSRVEDYRRRYLAWCVDAVETLETRYKSADGVEATLFLKAEHLNIHQALNYCVEHPEHAPVGLRLAGALWRFWSQQGHIGEGRRWLDNLLAFSKDVPPPIVAAALNGAGNLAYLQGAYADALSLHQNCLALRRQGAAPIDIARSLNNLGAVSRILGDYELASVGATESMALIGDSAYQIEVARAWNTRGNVARDLGQFVEAEEYFSRSLQIRELYRNLPGVASTECSLGEIALFQGDMGLAERRYQHARDGFEAVQERSGLGLALLGLARCAFRKKDLPAATSLAQECWSLFRALGDSNGAFRCLELCAGIAEKRENREQATQLLSASSQLRKETGAVQPPCEKPEYDALLVRLQAALEERSFKLHWEFGRYQGAPETIPL